MPQLFRIGAYTIYFWSNEGQPLEPVHVHIAEGRPVANGTKLWVLADGSCRLAGDSTIPATTLKRLAEIIENNHDYIIQQWVGRFGEARFIDERGLR